MTLSIDADTRRRASTPLTSKSDKIGRMRLAAGVRWFTVTAAVASIACIVAAVIDRDLPTELAASTLCVVCAIGGALWVGNALLADRLDFYQRGQLDGWMRGWRGQEPEVDDPLLR